MLGRWFDRLLREDLWGRYCWSCNLQEEEELARSGGRTAQEEGSAGARAQSQELVGMFAEEREEQRRRPPS